MHTPGPPTRPGSHDCGVHLASDLAPLAEPGASAGGLLCGPHRNSRILVLCHGDTLQAEAKGHGQTQRRVDLCNE